MKLSTINTLEKATCYLSICNTELRKLQIEKEKVTKPLNEALKAERARFKPFEDELEGRIEQIKKTMSGYLAIEDKKRVEALQALVSQSITPSQAITTISNNDTKKVITDAGRVSFVDIKRYRVLDISKVPVQYMLPNDPAIREAMKAGVSIAGVEYYTEKSIRNYTTKSQNVNQNIGIQNPK